nr:hypothetical protein NG677_04520 [Methylobacterium sp. OTU13CASTA1]
MTVDTSTQAPHPIALTAAGRRLADALVKVGLITEREAIRWPAALNAAAEILMPAEGAGLREAAQMFVNHYPHGINPFLDRAHTLASTALASPQPAVEGPVAAGVGEAQHVRDLELQEIADGAYGGGLAPGRAREMLASRTLTPPADPKPSVPGNDAGTWEALKKAERALKPFANRVYNDNGDISVSDTFRCGLDEFTAAYFAHRTCVAALTPQTGSAGEDPKTPDAGRVHEAVADSFKVQRDFTLETLHTLGVRLGVLAPEIACDGPQLLAAMSAYSDSLAQPAPVGDVEIAVREALYWAVSRWKAEVENRPMQNVHRRTLDTTWRQVMRYFGGDPDALVGPSHDCLANEIAPVGEDETGMREDDEPSYDELNRLAGLPAPNFANQPPKAETPAGVGEDALRAAFHEGAEHQRKRATYFSTQETACACCHIRKHTPLRVDDLGGYVCLTCIDRELEIALPYKAAALSAAPAARPGDGVERVWKTDAEIIAEVNNLAAFMLSIQGTGYRAPEGFKFYEAPDTDIRPVRAWVNAIEAYEMITGTEVRDALLAVQEDQDAAAPAADGGRA